jgi:hypothetical protein
MTTHRTSKILLTAGLLSFAICAAATAAGKMVFKEQRAGPELKISVVQSELRDAEGPPKRHEMNLVVCFPAGVGISAYVPGRLDIATGYFGLCSADFSR